MRDDISAMARFPIHAAWLLLALPFVQACAATADHAPVAAQQLPRLLTASPDSRVGGEARYEGELQIQSNCVLVVSDNRAAVPIFDASVSMTETGEGIIDSRSGEHIAAGERVRAAAAYLRQDGEGWSRSDIEASTGTTLPANCGDTIIRLRSISGTADVGG